MKINMIAMLLVCLTAACSNKNDAPLANLLAPGGSDAFDIGSAVRVEFTASDPDGTAAADVVVIGANGSEHPLATALPANGTPQTVTWNTNGFPIGAYRIEVRARDNSGATTSTQVSEGVNKSIWLRPAALARGLRRANQAANKAVRSDTAVVGAACHTQARSPSGRRWIDSQPLSRNPERGRRADAGLVVAGGR